jgi:hypothetical protein
VSVITTNQRIVLASQGIKCLADGDSGDVIPLIIDGLRIERIAPGTVIGGNILQSSNCACIIESHIVCFSFAIVVFDGRW